MDYEWDYGTPCAAHTARVLTQHVGGGCRVDLIELVTGEVLALNGESVVLWPSRETWERADEIDASDFPTIHLLPDVTDNEACQ